MKTTYIDFEDDITAVIGKLAEADDKEVRLVIPKRSTLFHSVVNMKLLQKNAREADKKIAFVTQDPKITGLAGHLGVPVAADTKSEPSVPETPSTDKELPSEVIKEDVEPAAAEPAAEDGTTTDKQLQPKHAKAKPKKQRAGKKDKQRFHIPDFDKFKKRLIIAIIAVILLSAGGWAATSKLPKAEVVLKAQIINTQTDFTFKADTNAQAINPDQRIVPAVTQEITKTLSKDFTATGEKKVGEKATGIITVSNCSESESFTLPGGTKFTAQNDAEGRTFTSNQNETVPGAVFSGGKCQNAGTVDVEVTASKVGDQYNLAAGTPYTIENYPNLDAEGNQMTGGTSRTITVVSKQDVNKARKSLLQAERGSTKQELATRFEEDVKVLEDSFTQKVKDVSSTPEVGEKASTGKVVVEVTYFQFGVTKDNLVQIIESELERQQDDGGEEPTSVIESEIDNATITLRKKPSSSRYVFRVQTKAVLGPDVDLEQLKRDIAGQGYSESLDQLKNLPKVADAEIDLSPFWVFSVPSNPESISIRVELPEDMEQSTEE